jgi:hypothetical protein
MRALIAHRRLVTAPGGSQKYELAIGSRNFACFNGFNVEGAFNKQNDPETVSMVTDLDGRFNNRVEDWLTTSNQRSAYAQGKTLGAWECVAIGWIYNGAQARSQGPLEGRAVPPNAKAYDFVVGNALRREGFMGRYYDAWNGGYVNSIRQLTPMETYLSRVFQNFEKDDKVTVPRAVQDASAFAAAVDWNQQSAGCLYQFVGSERPAGQAVAFLQTFRNVSEVQYYGWTGSNALKNSMINAAWGNISRVTGSTESIYPLMDHLVNHGTDNAITCYAGYGVMLHGMKYGFWSLAEFFHNPASMVIEGRYNKGAQSTNLSSKYTTAARWCNVQLGGAAHDLFISLKTSAASAPAEVGPMVTFDQICRNAAQGVLDGLISRVAEKIRAVAQSDQTANINRLIGLMRDHGDARRPPEPVAPPVAPPVSRAPVAPTQGAAQSATPRNATAGAAIGFVQWTSTAVH